MPGLRVPQKLADTETRPGTRSDTFGYLGYAAARSKAIRSTGCMSRSKFSAAGAMRLSRGLNLAPVFQGVSITTASFRASAVRPLFGIFVRIAGSRFDPLLEIKTVHYLTVTI